MQQQRKQRRAARACCLTAGLLAMAGRSHAFIINAALAQSGRSALAARTAAPAAGQRTSQCMQRASRRRAATMSDAAGAAVAEPIESNAPAPATFVQCIQQAALAVQKAIADGHTLLEVEFPPLSQEFMEDSSSSAYDVSRANVRLASQFGEFFAIDGKRVSVLLPDSPELERAIEDEGTDELFPRVKLCTARQNTQATAQSFDQIFGSFFGGKSGQVEPIAGTDMYVAIVFSCQEMPDLQRLHTLDPSKPIIFFNLKLDTQRGDLGLPAFPAKTLHYDFMCRIKPAYLLRTRAYSKSLSRPPFLVNYQGAQFRVYPGAYQSLLDVGNGRYKQVAKTEARPALGEFKDILTSALQLDEGEGKVASFFRKGYKTRTWWEDEKAHPMESSNAWRT